ncbi:ATPase AAA [Bifidobacterium lemurum]|uniref:ATPase AAA n=1 Tax=Bifidobacterium lemurum TaxID=1603886 RepID=A0A261FN22_9BIFI|nr:ATP-binding protein [Bifidobacterium lemurum]OZG60572.1 ATPase AAA [Bifidobacterium lemurum]QOL34209.1 ATP-binding protein [Bifidobacterium lemurum]
MIPRAITPTMIRQFQQFPILTLTGTRQSGKTTLIREQFPQYDYVSLENPDAQSLAVNDPLTFLARYNNHAIFDEAQRVPQLFSYLQGIVDERGQEPGQFILSGSQNFLLMQGISQSLAGRASVLHLMPLSHSELANADMGMDMWVRRGGYPRIYDIGLDPIDYFPNYVSTYVERDVREELGVRKLSQFRDFLVQCAVRVGEVVNYSAMASACGVNAKTVEEWISMLESSFIAFRLHPYHKNFGKRLIKAPKLYFYDTGLASYLLDLESDDELMMSKYRGPLFENAVVSEIMKAYAVRGRTPRLYYWRDDKQQEIDLIIEKGGAVRYAVEVKASATYDSHAFATISKLSEIMGLDLAQRIVVYGGRDSMETSFGRLLTIGDIPQLTL